MSLDLERPAKVRKVFDAITASNVTGAVLDLYGEEIAPRVLMLLTGELNGIRNDSWDKASALYDVFGDGSSQDD